MIVQHADSTNLPIILTILTTNTADNPKCASQDDVAGGAQYEMVQ